MSRYFVVAILLTLTTIVLGIFIIFSYLIPSSTIETTSSNDNVYVYQRHVTTPRTRNVSHISVNSFTSDQSDLRKSQKQQANTNSAEEEQDEYYWDSDHYGTRDYESEFYQEIATQDSTKKSQSNIGESNDGRGSRNLEEAAKNQEEEESKLLQNRHEYVIPYKLPPAIDYHSYHDSEIGRSHEKDKERNQEAITSSQSNNNNSVSQLREYLSSPNIPLVEINKKLGEDDDNNSQFSEGFSNIPKANTAENLQSRPPTTLPLTPLQKTIDSGLYRQINAFIWDPHPSYKFRAFNQTFHLLLRNDHHFANSKFSVTTHTAGNSDNNHTTTTHREPISSNLHGCLYNGIVLGDPKSVVAVSLCHGMTGHIKTSQGSFFIEPIHGEWNNVNPSKPILHEIYQLPSIFSPPNEKQHNTTESADNNDDDNNLIIKSQHHNSDNLDYIYDNRTHLKNQWEEDNLFVGTGQNKESSHTRKKRSMSRERYVELLVVTDSTMSNYHGENLNHYVLTLLSIVALIYKDPTIGNPMKCNVNFHILKDKDFISKPVVDTMKATQGQKKINRNSSTTTTSSTTTMIGGTSASDMMRNFCKWQKEHNTLDDDSIHHHDTALLLTRETICRNPWINKCDTLGLAELGTMCDHYASCAIVQDNGLSAAFTIAHELGHVLIMLIYTMNMPHDDDYKCSTFRTHAAVSAANSASVSEGWSIQHYVMSRMLDHRTYPWAWSRCSRFHLTEFLDAGHGYCLEDTPQINLSEDSSNDITDDTRLSNGINGENNGRTLQPGELFSEHKQCELVFGNSSRLCSYMPVCRRLWCTTDGTNGRTEEQEGCRTQHMPWADGTSCGSNKWCQRGLCVPKDFEKLKVIDGGWGNWHPWGNCSRTCAGGIKKSYRECDNPTPTNGGKYCVGPRVRYESCNTNDCPITSNSVGNMSPLIKGKGEYDSKDFRWEQCSKFNHDNFNIQGLPKDVIWLPKYNGISPKDRCKLFCRVQGSSSYYLLREKTIDGTPCNYDFNNNFDMCVNGVCLPAGCDRRLYSRKALDQCGLCGGDNSTCETKQGSYNESKYGYSDVLMIPTGSSNIDIRQYSHDHTARDDNYLAISDPQTNEYILNGNFVVSMFKKIIFLNSPGNIVIEYSGSDSIVERINSSSKPLESEILIQVLSVGKLNSPNIQYQYVLSTSKSNHKVVSGTRTGSLYKIRTYKYIFANNWSNCTQPCQGTQMRRVICVEETENNKQVHDSYCELSFHSSNEAEEREQTRKCNTHCKLKWSKMNHCEIKTTPSITATICSKNPKEILIGRMASSIRCIMEYPSLQSASIITTTATGLTRNFTIVSNELCQQQIHHHQQIHVQNQANTNRQSRLLYHSYATSSSDSISTNEEEICYETCSNYIANHQSVVHETTNEKQNSNELKNGNFNWKLVSQWTECNTRCGDGIQTRIIHCMSNNENGQKERVSDEMCDSGNKPVAERRCNNGPCGKWKVDQWSPCSVTCGVGISRAAYACYLNQATFLPPDYCDREQRPIIERACYGILETCSEENASSTEKSNSISRQKKISSELNWSNAETDNAIVVSNELIPPAATTTTEIPFHKQNNERYLYQWSLSYSHQWSNCTEGKRDLAGSSSIFSKPYRHKLPICMKRREISSCPGEWEHIPDSYCRLFAPKRNLHEEMIHWSEECGTWRAGNWSNCNFTCPTNITNIISNEIVGFETRNVGCYSTSSATTANNFSIRLADVQCVWPKPDDIRNCVVGIKKCLGDDEDYGNNKVPRTHRSHRDFNARRNFNRYATITTEPINNEGLSTNNQLAADQAIVYYYRWNVESWNECSRKCGTKGMKTRKVICMRYSGSSSFVAALTAQDNNNNGTVTNNKKTGTNKTSRHHHQHHKSKLGKLLHGINQIDKLNGNSSTRPTTSPTSGIEVNDKLCATWKKPKIIRGCNRHICPFKWIISHWSECSKSCGYGIEHRTVSCHKVNEFNWIDPDPLPTGCEFIPKPKEYGYCSLSDCSSRFTWYTEPWSQCSSSCISNISSTINLLKNSSLNTIHHIPRQRRRVYCILKPTNEPTYQLTDNIPTTMRTATSIAKRPQRVNNLNCRKEYRPIRKRKCLETNNLQCGFKSCKELRDRMSIYIDGEYSLLVGGRNTSIYCYGMSSNNRGSSIFPKEYLTLKYTAMDLSERQRYQARLSNSISNSRENEERPEDNIPNFSEVYSKRLIRPDTCPRGGIRLQSCECVEDRNRRIGFTLWLKVRMNVTNLQIDAEDFTWTKQMDQWGRIMSIVNATNQIPFGTAGDCYSTMNCPQGKFNINLKATGFKISTSTSWTTQGHKTSINLNKLDSNQIISGKCGGYCGSCSPNRLNGLKLEVSSY